MDLELQGKRALADELVPARINVKVVHPGLTRTERTAPLVATRAAAQGVGRRAASTTDNKM